jgi:hypothetical protein
MNHSRPPFVSKISYSIIAHTFVIHAINATKSKLSYTVKCRLDASQNALMPHVEGNKYNWHEHEPV